MHTYTLEDARNVVITDLSEAQAQQLLSAANFSADWVNHKFADLACGCASVVFVVNASPYQIVRVRYTRNSGLRF